MSTNDGTQDVRINLKADINEATRSLRELQRQINKLGDLADQGSNRQRGFLSPKQVQMYRRMMSEIENTHSASMRRMADAEEKYNKRFEREEYKKLKQLEDNLKKRQEAVRRAEGGNKWGDVSSPSVQEFHRHKLEEAKSSLNSYQNSPNFKSAVQDTKELESQLATLRGSVDDLRSETERANSHANRINNLTQQNQQLRREVMGGASAMANGVGAVTALGGYASYTLGGVDHLRQQELQASGITQKLGAGYEKADAKHRDSTQVVGVANQYSMADTLALQANLARSGITDARKLNKDTESVQRFSRAYATDPNLMADGNSMLRQMGSIEEGQMQRFADLIGGAISSNTMNGREEEMLRATSTLAASVGHGLDKMSSQQLSNIVGLQTQVGEVSTLRGERGANMLTNLDNSIKNGGNNMDLLLGKGVEFQGFEGMRELGYLKEEGIANPENLQRMLRNSKRIFGKDGKNQVEMALAQEGSMTQHEFRALDKAGILDRWENGDFASADEIAKAGATDTADKIRQWQGTESKDFTSNTGRNLDLKSDHAKLAEDGITGANSAWNDLWDPVQHALLPAAAIGGSMAIGAGVRGMVGRGWDDITRRANGRIGGNGGFGGRVTGGAKALAKGASKLIGPAGFVASANMAADAGGGVGDWLFGHQAGQQRYEGLFSNPFNGNQAGKYEEDRQGAISKGWDWLTGGSNKASASGLDTTDASANSLEVNTLNVNDRAFADYFSDKNSTDKTSDRYEEMSVRQAKTTSRNQQQTFKVEVSGKVDGVTPETEEVVKGGFQNYFTNLMSNGYSKNGLDLSQDQGRT